MHALLYEGTYEWALPLIDEVFRTEGPDVMHIVRDRLTIDDVRALTLHAHRTPLTLDVRAFVIAADEMTLEAQNALLKLLEEPPATARFFIVTPRADELLPTVRSRLIRLGHDTEESSSSLYDEFIRAPYAERLSMIADHMAKKDDSWAHGLMNAFESWAHAHEDKAFLRALMDLRSTFGSPGASKKMILEHLALLLPLSSKR